MKSKPQKPPTHTSDATGEPRRGAGPTALAKVPTTTALDKPEPTARKKAAIEKAWDRLETERPVRFSVALNGKFASSPHTDQAGHIAESLDTFATTSPDFSSVQVGNLSWAAGQRGDPDPKAAQMNLNSSLAVVGAVAPRDELEAALAVQMSGIHNLAAEMLGRAKTCERTDHTELYANLAVKLARTFSAQTEALAKLRSAGKQTVEVIHVHKHVYVAPGGQAIVGDVHRGGGGGGGGQPGNAAQPHASALAYAPGVQMPGSNPPWDLVPVASGVGEEEVSDARRREG